MEICIAPLLFFGLIALLPVIGAVWQAMANAQSARLKDDYMRIRIQSAASLMESRRLDQILKAQRQVETGNKGVISDLKIEELELKIKLLQRELGIVDKGQEFHADRYD